MDNAIPPAAPAANGFNAPPPPQVLALKAYITMVTEMNKAGVKPDEIPERMRQATITAIECACRAQRSADALLVDVIAERSMLLGAKDVGSYLARVLRGEEHPTEALGGASGLLVVP